MRSEQFTNASAHQRLDRTRSGKERNGTDPRHVDDSCPRAARYATSEGAFLALAKLKGADRIRIAATHNLRERHSAGERNNHIDNTKHHLNTILAGPSKAAEVATRAKEIMKRFQIDPARLRKDAVRCIEIVFSLSAWHSIDHDVYFLDCCQWTATEFGGRDNILSAVVHKDEDHPHCHVLILPLRDGHMQGSDMVGGPSAFSARLGRFHGEVSLRHGLRPYQRRLSRKNRIYVAQVVERALIARDDPALKSPVWPALWHAVQNDPISAAQALKLDLRNLLLATNNGQASSYGATSALPTSAPLDRPICSVGFANTGTPWATDVRTDKQQRTNLPRMARELGFEREAQLLDATTSTSAGSSHRYLRPTQDLVVRP